MIIRESGELEILVQ